MRDLLYTGNPIEERASIVLRIAPTFMRFGSFEIFKPTDSHTGTPQLAPSVLALGFRQSDKVSLQNRLLRRF
jgi:uncharacterized protein YdiU (UPF0061 family)